MGAFDHLQRLAQLIPRHAAGQGAHPCGEDQRLRRVGAHLAIPFAEHLQHRLAPVATFVADRLVPGPPEVAGDQRQDGAGHFGHGVVLDFLKAFQRVEFARVQFLLNAPDAVGRGPFVGDVVREGGVG